jgi:hypothetical protein
VTLEVLVGKDRRAGVPGSFSVGPGSSHNCKAGRKMEFATGVNVDTGGEFARVD